MSKSVLLIDDEDHFKEAFKIISQNKGYKLAWGRSFEDLEKLLPNLISKITAVILDVKCLIKNNQEIEKADFLGVAINFLNQNYPELPRIILTGDEKALDAFKMLFNTDTEDIYTKSPTDIEELFDKLDVHLKNFPKRILEAEERHILELIENDEDKKLEFKSSLRFCVKKQVKDKSLEFECFKNIAAFLNTQGGTLLIGIDDDQKIIGLENTDFITFKKDNKADGFKLHLDNLVEKYFGNPVQRLIDVKMIKLGKSTVCKMTVYGKYSSPIFIKKIIPGNKPYDAFYIRRSASAKELISEELEEYLRGNWAH